MQRRSTVFSDDICEGHATPPPPRGGAERSGHRGSENAGGADAEGQRSPARPLGRVLLEAAVGERQPDLAPAPAALEGTQDSRLRNGDAGRPRFRKGCVTNVREAEIRLLMFLKSNRFDKIIH